MKLITRFLPVILLIALINGCAYDDFKEDYEFSTVYFTNQILKRSFVEDEINKIKIGVVLGGKRTNAKDEWVSYTIDTSGLGNTSYELLPEKYYTLSNDEQFIISSGNYIGEVSMKINESFFEDSLACKEHYAIPFRLTETSADSIHSGKDSLLLIMNFEAKIFGTYYHNGQVIRKNPDDGTIVDTIRYHEEEPVTNKKNIWTLYTSKSKTVHTRGLGQYAPSDLTGFYIRLNEDNSLELMEDTSLISLGYDWKFEETNEENNYYDPETRKLFLNYKFNDVSKGYDCYVHDTLIFRNRMLDGVNQWNL